MNKYVSQNRLRTWIIQILSSLNVNRSLLKFLSGLARWDSSGMNVNRELLVTRPFVQVRQSRLEVNSLLRAVGRPG